MTNENNTDNSGLFIPAGLFIGFASGFIFGNLPAGIFGGLGLGFLMFALNKNINTNSLEERNDMSDEKTTKEEFKVSGDALVQKVKDIIKAGNARRIILKNEKGDVLMEIPLTFAVVGTVLAPILAAVGALAALVTECSVVVVKKDGEINKEG